MFGWIKFGALRCCRAAFKLSFESNFAFAFVLFYCAFCLVGKIRATFSTNEKQNQTICDLLALVFPRLTRIDVSFGSNSDWFIVLFTFAVIGVKTINRKPF